MCFPFFSIWFKVYCYQWARHVARFARFRAQSPNDQKRKLWSPRIQRVVRRLDTGDLCSFAPLLPSHPVFNVQQILVELTWTYFNLSVFTYLLDCLPGDTGLEPWNNFWLCGLKASTPLRSVGLFRMVWSRLGMNKPLHQLDAEFPWGCRHIPYPSPIHPISTVS